MNTAPISYRDERPDATPLSSRRSRRRGPRSLISLSRRSVSQSNSFLSQTHSSLSPPADDLCQSRSISAVEFDKLSILQCNLRGWISHHDELEACLNLVSLPFLIFLNETLLDASIERPELSGYELVGRHETASTRRGIAVFAKNGLASDIVLVHKSDLTERMWFILHT